jgi:hypothetical protein
MAMGQPRIKSGDRVLAAARIRAEERGRPAGSALADRYEAPALEALPGALAGVGGGGELVIREDTSAPALRSTVEDPSFVTADASRDRLELLQQAGALELGLDAAETVGAADSLEKMLAHQLAALHRSTLRLTVQLNSRLEYAERTLGSERDRANIEACRLAGAVARIGATFQQGVQTMKQAKSKGRQTITVRHLHQNVQVNEGGQAVVAGEVGGGPRKQVGG